MINDIAISAAVDRDVVLTKSAKYKYFGFTCRGSKPVFFNVVDAGGLAESDVRTLPPPRPSTPHPAAVAATHLPLERSTLPS